MEDAFPNFSCPVHGSAAKRAECSTCNAAYMRAYLRKRRHQQPAKELWSRARKRADKLGLPFAITPDDIFIPPTCPIFGIPLIVGGGRSAHSPSLDRISPALGYMPGNVRVVSDRANRLKGRYNLAELQDRAINGPEHLKADYKLLVGYLERETLLTKVRARGISTRQFQMEWRQITDILQQVCTFGLATGGSPHPGERRV